LKVSSLTITIPELPSAALKSGFRGGWWLIRKAKVHDTEMAYVYSLIAYREKNGDGRLSLPMKSVTASVTYVFKETRRRDLDNWIGRLKGYWDGIVKAGIIEDDNIDIITSINVKFEIDKSRAPLTIITLSEVGDDNE
jgi:Holliday junction resolvase RusA-like endonuclease